MMEVGDTHDALGDETEDTSDAESAEFLDSFSQVSVSQTHYSHSVTSTSSTRRQPLQNIRSLSVAKTNFSGSPVLRRSPRNIRREPLRIHTVSSVDDELSSDYQHETAGGDTDGEVELDGDLPEEFKSHNCGAKRAMKAVFGAGTVQVKRVRGVPSTCTSPSKVGQPVAAVGVLRGGPCGNTNVKTRRRA
ncbi:hypothetical protein HDU93_002627 [Gonapodya sp. JEL0774]|nr:hypothetical protein HDU93_002627 [Gonapodya sp. JEL0774]